MKTFPQLTLDIIRKGITGAEGWAYYNWAVEDDAGFWGAKFERKTDSPVKQEYKKRLKRLREKKQE